MRSAFRSVLHVPALAALMVTTAVPLRAQYIAIETTPVARADQFMVFPSQRLGMGGATIAIRDRLLDPWNNPAAGSRLSGSQLFGIPSVSSISRNGGSTFTLPVGITSRGKNLFGGGLVALQQIEAGSEPLFFFRGPVAEPFFDAAILPPWPSADRLSGRYSTNFYADGFLGFKAPGSRTSFGVGAGYAGLDAISGVEHLYAGNMGLEQSGHRWDLKVGLIHQMDGDRSLEFTLLTDRMSMRHEVSYLDWVLDSIPAFPPDTFMIYFTNPIDRQEINQDRTNTWGGTLSYDQPLTQTGWRVGGSITANVKTHPGIPNYSLQNIPRDPGNSSAYNFGVGISRQTGDVSFAMDLVVEPIWSNTWQEADSLTMGGGGIEIPIGGRTINNDFKFLNGMLSVGVGMEDDRKGFQLGLNVRSVNYTLNQVDRVDGIRREQSEGWIEWTPSWGAVVKLAGIDLRYFGQLTKGRGRVGTDTFQRFEFASAGGLTDIIIAPEGPLTLSPATVIMHRVMFSMPIK